MDDPYPVQQEGMPTPGGPPIVFCPNSSPEPPKPAASVAAQKRRAQKITQLVVQQKDVHPRRQLIPFGHLAEGNLHLNHIGASRPERIADMVLSAVASLGGTISAEHGIGVAKAPWLHLIRNPAELAAQAAIRNGT